MRFNFEQMKQIINLCIRVNKGEKIKEVCNELNVLGITPTDKYNKENKYSCYQMFRNLYYNFLEFGISGILDLRGMWMANGKDKNNNQIKHKNSKMKRDEEYWRVRNSLTSEQKDELIEMYENIIDSLTNDSDGEFAKFKEIINKYKNKKKCSITKKDLCTLFCINRSTLYKYFDYIDIYEKDNVIDDRRYRKDAEKIKALINDIYNDSNCTYGRRKILCVLRK